MRGRIYDRLALPPSCWEAPDMLDALASRDVGHLFRTAQKLTGASQTHIGMSTGLSQAQVSEIMGRKRQVTTIDVLARVVTGLGIPEPARTVLLLGDRAYAGQAVADPLAVNPVAVDPVATVPVTAASVAAASVGTVSVGTVSVGTVPVSAGPVSAGPIGTVPVGTVPIAAEPAVTAPEDSDYGDVVAVYATRSEFMSRLPPHALLDSSREVRAAGLSLNLICQHYADNRLIYMLNEGTRMRCLFLDPAGEAIRAREREEGYSQGHLSALTNLNIQNLLRRVRDRVDQAARERLEIGVYDETIRFNVLLLDDSLCVAQPYLPEMRGVDSPTLVMRRRPDIVGLYGTFDSLFGRLWERARIL